MKRNSQSGVALVITLIMLSVITLLAVAFLGTTRRERTSVTVTSAQIDAKLMADAALSRAIAEEINLMLSGGSVLNYDLIVSTNRDGAGDVQFPMALSNVASAMFDPRVPVYTTNTLGGAPVTNFPFWLDFNRNTVFDVATNGSNVVAGDPQWIGVLADPSTNHFRTNRFVGRYAFLVMPTGKSLDINYVHNYAKHLVNNMPSDGYFRNQGVGTWEYNLAAFFNELTPDVPGLHGWNYNAGNLTNLSSGTGSGLTNDSFLSAHEIIRFRYGGTNNNLASFTNLYSAVGAGLFGSDDIDGYTDGPLMTGLSLLTNETLATPFNPDDPSRPWPGAANPNVISDLQDLVDTKLRSRYPTFQDQLRSAMAPVNTNRLDRNTFYRMAAQMGTESTATPSLQTVRSLVSTNTEATGRSVAHGLGNGDYVEIRGATPAAYNGVYPVRILNGNTFQYDFAGTGNISASGVMTMRRLKINLNFDNIVRTNLATGLASETNFFAWAPTNFFRVVADRLIQLNKTVAGGRTFLGTNEVRPNLSITNIMLYPTNEYTATLHRILQQAVNLWDATTNTARGTVPPSDPGYPTVFRPVFTRAGAGGEVRIVDYAEVVDLAPIGQTKYDIAAYAALPAAANVDTDILYGVPLVIGARRGYPNFNEFSVLMAAKAHRKLQVRRGPLATDRPYQTNQMFFLSITNHYGLEVWNSYSNAFPRPLAMYWQLTNTVRLSNEFGYLMQSNSGLPLSLLAVPANTWAGFPGRESSPLVSNSFKIPFNTRLSFMTNSIYRAVPAPGTFVPTSPFSTNSAFETNSAFVTPTWMLTVSNQMFYALADTNVSPGRIVDFVALNDVSFTTNLTAAFAEPSGAVGGGDPGAQLWNTNRAAAGAPTAGVLEQIRVSRTPGVQLQAPYDWNSYRLVAANQPDAARNFESFLTTNNWPVTNAQIMNAPYMAPGFAFRLFRWQANDPLVHYMVEDLNSPEIPNPVKFAPNGSAPVSLVGGQGNIGAINGRYHPWGRTGSPDDMGLQDPLITRSDDWKFPTNKFGNLGWIGRVHRGTPWQTVFLKSAPTDGNFDLAWQKFVGRQEPYATNDWRMAELFTTAIDPNSLRGLLSINQTNRAAWAAALGGVDVLEMGNTDSQIDATTPKFTDIYNGIQNTRLAEPNRVFTNLSRILAVPQLSINSPYVTGSTLDDAAVERIPQQLLSLLTVEEVPRITVYAWGQSLKPARQSLFPGGGTNFQLCTNYQITGEVVTKTVLRIEGTTNAPRAVVESYNVLSNP